MNLYLKIIHKPKNKLFRKLRVKVYRIVIANRIDTTIFIFQIYLVFLDTNCTMAI